MSASYVVGVSMVVLEITLSGWISAYFEKHLKNGQSTVWGRNLQLSFWSMLIYGVIQVVQSFNSPDHSMGLHQGDHNGSAVGTQLVAEVLDSSVLTSFFRMWSPVSLMLVVLGGGGGLLVAFAIKYADAVMKSMASAFSLVIVCFAEMLFLGSPADPVVVLACGVALLGLQTYNEAHNAPPLSPSRPEIKHSVSAKAEDADPEDADPEVTLGVGAPEEERALVPTRAEA
mmetsp:Transcript_29665/g.76074  ORF Transcript_29665/g.76074 Transcript_29665/m.76074 type:complete len:229 (+) Transcript_29665:1-687(+)